MERFVRFLLSGLVLGLYAEGLLKLVAGVHPATFVVTLFAYPVFVTLSYVASETLDRLVSSRWKADLLHYAATGVGGLSVEWVFLGNGPGSNAIQLGMVAMWTTFCFGPRVLSRDAWRVATARRRFWMAFGVAAVVLVIVVFLTPQRSARVIIAILGLTGTSIIWSLWLLILAWRGRNDASTAGLSLAHEPVPPLSSH